MASAFQSNAFQDNAFQIDEINPAILAAQRDVFVLTREERERIQAQIERSRERAEKDRKNRLKAEEQRLAELRAIYARITGEPEEVKPVKAKPIVKVIKQEAARLEGVIRAMLELEAERAWDEIGDDAIRFLFDAGEL